ncbi:MAG: hypoxanthine phosphoribosyltransferase [Chloroflexi bacterium]|nr:MAG: hypoxanthine phosphoribosyltransferase [Chloroflexota bacterium]
MPESVTSRPPAPRARASRRAPGRAMISSERISKRVRQLGREISEVYGDIETPLVIVAILKGATVFAADLLRSLSIPAELEFVRAASYGAGTKTTGRVKIAHMVEGSLAGRHVLLVEDIVDSGRTIDTILKRFRRMKPASLRVAALLDRPARREIRVQIDFTGFVIPDRFVIGYGLDYAGLYRELPGIYALS